MVSADQSTCGSYFDIEYLPAQTNSSLRAALIGANLGSDRSGDEPGETAWAGAIFLHRHSDSNGSTRASVGCVTLSGPDLDDVLPQLDPSATYFVITA